MNDFYKGIILGDESTDDLKTIGKIFEKCNIGVLLHMADLAATYLSENKEECNAI